MKKIFLTLFILLICLTISAIGFYYTYRDDMNHLMKFNSEFEEYKDKKIKGTEIATVINKSSRLQ